MQTPKQTTNSTKKKRCEEREQSEPLQNTRPPQRSRHFARDRPPKTRTAAIKNVTLSLFFPERGLIIPAVAPKLAAVPAAPPAAAGAAADVGDGSSRAWKTFEATYDRLLLSRRAEKRAVDCADDKKRTTALREKQRGSWW